MGSEFDPNDSNTAAGADETEGKNHSSAICAFVCGSTYNGTAFTFAAKTKSLSVSPSILCVHSVNFTLPHAT